MIKLKTPNSMEIAGQPAVITYVPELNAFRGKFLGLSGYCDFVSDSIQGLQKEGEDGQAGSSSAKTNLPGDVRKGKEERVTPDGIT